MHVYLCACDSFLYHHNLQHRLAQSELVDISTLMSIGGCHTISHCVNATKTEGSFIPCKQVISAGWQNNNNTKTHSSSLSLYSSAHGGRPNKPGSNVQNSTCPFSCFSFADSTQEGHIAMSENSLSPQTSNPPIGDGDVAMKCVVRKCWRALRQLIFVMQLAGGLSKIQL